MSTSTSTTVRKKIQPRSDLPPPGKFQVVFFNDDVTSMEFVIMVLHQIFGYDSDTSHDLTMRIHLEGNAVVAVLPYEIAEQKAIEVTLLARKNSFPLDVRVRADD